ncbi:hypothetical protein M0D69_07235 [Caballeronia sp. SEWSISQ10-4 2]|uniref:hypothetical protein n=1 Tax=Caballeronia sp. SEWSISQ10-4 2 TaxID=2937438 RepID=UPI002652E65C|nr:hypothetical protein [Caballeronia sp. SEWSISQ10-4 2]MDN7177816.1 hypothetical protein [Caballeronia sp. SEWSISQ10-4 2]
MTLFDASPLRIKLMPSTSDGTVFRAECQAGLKKFYDHLLSNGVLVTPVVFTMDSGTTIGGLVGEFVVTGTQIIGVTLGVAIAGWFKGRSGRRLTLNVGDIQIEAGTSDELARLLEHAIAVREGP